LIGEETRNPQPLKTIEATNWKRPKDALRRESDAKNVILKFQYKMKKRIPEKGCSQRREKQKQEASTKKNRSSKLFLMTEKLRFWMPVCEEDIFPPRALGKNNSKEKYPAFL
jgi:hypothetical protein